MKNRIAFFTISAAVAVLVSLPYLSLMADGYKATPAPLARSLSESQIDAVVDAAPRDANVGVPAWYAAQAPAYRDAGTNRLVAAALPALGAVIADSRKNIPELEGLSDVEVGALYLAQMQKPADELARLAPTNSLEYLIGAGIRADLKKMEGGK